MGIENRTFGAGYLLLGHVFLPYPGNNKDKDSQEGEDYRTRIIKQCYRKKAVSVLFNNGTFANNCPVSKSCLNDIEFPEKFGEVGSPVVVFMEPLHKKPMVINVFGREDEIYFIGEGDKNLTSVFNTSSAEVLVKGKSGEVFINADSNDPDGGNIWINVSNNQNKGKLNIRVLGSSIIHTSGNCTVESSSNVNVNVTDVENKIVNSVNVSKSKVTLSSTQNGEGNSIEIDLENVKANKLNVGNGTSPIPKGDELKKQLDYCKDRIDAIIDAIKNAPVTAGDGGATFKAAIVASLEAIQNKEDYSNINSKISFTN